MEEENDKQEFGSRSTQNEHLPESEITPESGIDGGMDQHDDVDDSERMKPDEEEGGGPIENMDIETPNEKDASVGISSTDNTSDDQLPSEISNLVDSKDGEVNCKEVDESCSDNLQQSTGITITEVKSGTILEGHDDKADDFNETLDHSQDRDLSDGNDANETMNNGETVDENNQDLAETPLVKESPFEKLANLGFVSKEEVEPDTKESALQKLVSRGAISITPAGGGSSMPSSSSSDKPLSITPSKPKYKAGPKSAMLKQKARQIKIDPGKSVNIEQDFNSLINFLSAGGVDKTMENSKNESLDIGLVGKDNSSIEKDKIEEKEESNNYLQEVDSANHEDGSKSMNCSSELSDDNCSITSNISKSDNKVEEGSAEILLSASPNVFYNKVQEFNRDMSIAAITVFSEIHQQDPRTRNRGKKRKAPGNDEQVQDNSEENVFEPGKKSENGITVLEALSATGLRSIRYAKEIPGIKEIIANDLSEGAVEAIKKNVEHNGVEDLITVSKSDASMLMYMRQAEQQYYDVIDLDPYGCPARFLDAAVQAVRDGGLLLVTCTDMAILAGNSPETCHAKYGSTSLRSPACHEMALRIALRHIESHANRYGRYISPMLSFSADFYIRVVVQVFTSPVTCKMTTSKLSMVYQCAGCQTFSLQLLGQVTQVGANNQNKFTLCAGPPVNKNCFFCNHRHAVGGPIWSAPLHNVKFVESMLNVVENGTFGTHRRMQGMLEVIREELPDVPLYYTISGLCSKLHCQAIPLIDIRSAILNAGYRVSSSHAAPTAVKTNAPAKVIWDIMRCWVHMNPVSEKRLVPGSVAAAVILEPPNLIANFDIHPKARPSSSMRKLVRYQQNPEKNWGPGTRAKCNNGDGLGEDKRKLNQNKNKNKTVQKHIDIIEVVTIDDEDEAMEEETPTESATATSSTANAE